MFGQLEVLVYTRNCRTTTPLATITTVHVTGLRLLEGLDASCCANLAIKPPPNAYGVGIRQCHVLRGDFCCMLNELTAAAKHLGGTEKSNLMSYCLLPAISALDEMVRK